MGTLGSRIAAARQARGWSQNELDQKAGLAKYRTIRYESDQLQPRVPTLGVLAKTLGVSVTWLIYGCHPPKADRELMRKLVQDELLMERKARRKQ